MHGAWFNVSRVCTRDFYQAYLRLYQELHVEPRTAADAGVAPFPSSSPSSTLPQGGVELACGGGGWTGDAPRERFRRVGVGPEAAWMASGTLPMMGGHAKQCSLILWRHSRSNQGGKSIGPEPMGVCCLLEHHAPSPCPCRRVHSPDGPGCVSGGDCSRFMSLRTEAVRTEVSHRRSMTPLPR